MTTDRVTGMIAGHDAATPVVVVTAGQALVGPASTAFERNHHQTVTTVALVTEAAGRTRAG